MYDYYVEVEQLRGVSRILLFLPLVAVQRFNVVGWTT